MDVLVLPIVLRYGKGEVENKGPRNWSPSPAHFSALRPTIWIKLHTRAHFQFLCENQKILLDYTACRNFSSTNSRCGLARQASQFIELHLIIQFTSIIQSNTTNSISIEYNEILRCQFHVY